MTTDLDARIRALVDATVDEAPAFVDSEPSLASPRRASFGRGTRVAGVVGVVVALVVALAVVVSRHGSRPGTVEATPTTLEWLHRTTVAGAEVSLRPVAIPRIAELWFNSAVGQGVQTETFLVDGITVAVTNLAPSPLPGAPPRNCLAVVEPANSLGGTAVEIAPSCRAGRKNQGLFLPDSASASGARVVYSWTEFPADTAYVTFRSSVLTAWERPVAGFAVFAATNAPVGVTLRAYDSKGRVIDHVTFAKSSSGPRTSPTPSTFMLPPVCATATLGLDGPVTGGVALGSTVWTAKVRNTGSSSCVVVASLGVEARDATGQPVVLDARSGGSDVLVKPGGEALIRLMTGNTCPPGNVLPTYHFHDVTVSVSGGEIALPGVELVACGPSVSSELDPPSP